MSKIVILSTQLGAPQVLGDLLQKIGCKNPGLAEWVRQLDTIPIIKECVENALTRLGQVNGIRKDSTVTDYYGKTYAGQLDGSLKTDKFPNGLGFKVNGQGMIEFVADDYKPEWREEIERLRKLFTDAFLAEATSSILLILGYEVKVSSTVTGSGELLFNLEGVKQ